MLLLWASAAVQGWSDWEWEKVQINFGPRNDDDDLVIVEYVRENTITVTSEIKNES
jgi:hypothetical protein